MRPEVEALLEAYREPRPGKQAQRQAPEKQAEGNSQELEIELQKVDSRLLTAYGYDPATQTLRVHFRKSRHTGDYRSVPAAAFQRMQAAASKGSFLLKEIIPNYEYQRRQ